MSLAATPSMSTLLKFDAPPRTNSDVTAPRCPAWTTCAPGTSRSASSTSGLARASSVAASITVTEAAICDGRTLVAAAVTDTFCSSGPIGNAISTDTRPDPPTNIGSVVRVWNPGELASIRYRPALSASKTNSPSAFEEASFTAFSPSSSLTVAPLTRAPSGSTTVPAMVPPVCAHEGGAASSTSAARARHMRRTEKGMERNVRGVDGMLPVLRRKSNALMSG